MSPLEDWLRRAVADVLERVLGAFVEGIDADSLKLDALGGDVTLKSLRLKISAFEALNLPLAVADGRLGEVRVKVPWRNLGSEPMLISIRTLHLLLTPLPAGAGGAAAAAKEAANALATKREALAAWEAVQEKGGEEEKLNWVDAQVQKMVRGVMQKLEIEVIDVHVRIQRTMQADSLAAGLLLKSLRVNDLPVPKAGGAHGTAKQIDEMLSALVRKSARIEGLAIYLTTASGGGEGTRAAAAAAASSAGSSMRVDEDGATIVRMPSLDLASHVEQPPSPPPQQPQPHGQASSTSEAMRLESIRDDSYLLTPINLHVDLELDPSHHTSTKWPKLQLNVTMDDELTISLRHAQFGSLLMLIETYARKAKRHRFRSCGRPTSRPMRGSGDHVADGGGSGGGTVRRVSTAALWWQYACRAVIHLACEDVGAVTWYELVKRRKQRLEYITQYAKYRYHGGWKRFHSTKEKAAKAHHDIVVAQLEALEGNMPIEMMIRYRGLSRAVSHQLSSIHTKWWELSKPKEMVAGVGPPAAAASKRRREKETEGGGFTLFGLHFGGQAAKKEEESRPAAAGGGDAAAGGAAARFDDDEEEDSSLRRRVRARWSIAGLMSEWQLQRLQEDLTNGDVLLPTSSSSDTSSSSSSSSSSSRLSADYIRAVIELMISGITLTLFIEGDEPLHSLQISSIRAQIRQRAHLNGIGLQAHLGTITYSDLSTQYTPLQRVIHGAHPLPGGQLLSLALETGKCARATAPHTHAHRLPLPPPLTRPSSPTHPPPNPTQSLSIQTRLYTSTRV